MTVQIAAILIGHEVTMTDRTVQPGAAFGLLVVRRRDEYEGVP